MSRRVVRIAVALSGGVDSSVTALFLRRCVQSGEDIAALWGGGWAAPDYETVRAAVRTATPWSSVVEPTTRRRWRCERRRDGHFRNAAVELLPFFMRNWHDREAAHGWCAAGERDWEDAQAVAWALGLVPPDRRLAVVDLSAAYADQCFAPLLAAYSGGDTLNVDVLCNSEIKFGAFVEDHLGWLGSRRSGARVFSPFDKHPCDYLATGHYARTVQVDGMRGSERSHQIRMPASQQQQQQQHEQQVRKPAGVLLARPITAESDLNDQTLFLAKVNPALWNRVLFPLGHLFRAKADVRRLCEAYGEEGSDGPWQRLSRKKTSTGVCFVGEAARSANTATADSNPHRRSCTHSFASFLQGYLPPPAQVPIPREGKGPMPLYTRFVEVIDASDSADVTSGTATQSLREIPSTRFLWTCLSPPCPSPAVRGSDGNTNTEVLFPAYAFTVGQRLRCAAAEGESGNESPRYYYVQDKVLYAAEENAVDDCRWLREVRLVTRWDHLLLLSRGPILLRDVTWHVSPLDLLRSSAFDGSDIRCVGCTRHLEALRPCRLAIAPHRPSGDGSGGEGDSCAVVRVEDSAAPFRALAPGQLFVAYMRLPIGFAAARAPDGEKEGTAAGDGPLVVVASGWVSAKVAPSPS